MGDGLMQQEDIDVLDEATSEVQEGAYEDVAEATSEVQEGAYEDVAEATSEVQEAGIDYDHVSEIVSREVQAGYEQIRQEIGNAKGEIVAQAVQNGNEPRQADASVVTIEAEQWQAFTRAQDYYDGAAQWLLFSLLVLAFLSAARLGLDVWKEFRVYRNA